MNPLLLLSSVSKLAIVAFFVTLSLIIFEIYQLAHGSEKKNSKKDKKDTLVDVPEFSSKGLDKDIQTLQNIPQPKQHMAMSVSAKKKTLNYGMVITALGIIVIVVIAGSMMYQKFVVSPDANVIDENSFLDMSVTTIPTQKLEVQDVESANGSAQAINTPTPINLADNKDSITPTSGSIEPSSIGTISPTNIELSRTITSTAENITISMTPSVIPSPKTTISELPVSGISSFTLMFAAASMGIIVLAMIL